MTIAAIIIATLILAGELAGIGKQLAKLVKIEEARQRKELVLPPAVRGRLE